MDEVCEGKEFSFPAEEQRVLRLWEELDAFHGQLRRTVGASSSSSTTGRPSSRASRTTATSRAHQGRHHLSPLHARPPRRAPLRLGLPRRPRQAQDRRRPQSHHRAQVLEMVIGKYNNACRGIVTQYVAEWEAIVTRMGSWVYFEDGYKTMVIKFMESVWWVFAQLWEDLVYKGFKVMPYSTVIKTALSNFEAGLHYKFVPADTAMVSFPVVGDVDNAILVAWTTPPWTLPCNLSLCVNANLVYAKVKDKSNGSVYTVAETRLDQLPVTVKVTGKISAPSKGSSGAAKNGLDTE